MYQYVRREYNMLTEKDYCDYETCVALKELGDKTPASAYYIPNNETLYFVSNPYRGGYVIDCFCSHNSLREDVMTHDFIDAPTMWEAQKWLREEKDIYIEILFQPATWTCKIYNLKKYEYIKGYTFFISYEEALSEGIKGAVKILKEE